MELSILLPGNFPLPRTSWQQKQCSQTCSLSPLAGQQRVGSYTYLIDSAVKRGVVAKLCGFDTDLSSRWSCSWRSEGHMMIYYAHVKSVENSYILKKFMAMIEISADWCLSFHDFSWAIWISTRGTLCISLHLFRALFRRMSQPLAIYGSEQFSPDK